MYYFQKQEYDDSLKAENNRGGEMFTEYNSIFSISKSTNFFTIVTLDKTNSYISKIISIKEKIDDTVFSELQKASDIFSESELYQGSSKIEKISTDFEKQNPGKILFDSTFFIFLNQDISEEDIPRYIFSLDILPQAFPLKIVKDENAANNYFSNRYFLIHNQNQISDFIAGFTKNYTCKRIANGQKKIMLKVVDTSYLKIYNEFYPISIRLNAAADTNRYWSYTDSIIQSQPVLCIDQEYGLCSKRDIEFANKYKFSFENGVPITDYLNTILKVDPSNTDTTTPANLPLQVEMVARVESNYYPFLLCRTSFPLTISLPAPLKMKMPDGTFLTLTNSEIVRLAGNHEISEDKLMNKIVGTTKNKVIILLLLVIVAFFAVWWFYYGRKNKKLLDFFKKRKMVRLDNKKID